jgi:hypothetical protein
MQGKGIGTQTTFFECTRHPFRVPGAHGVITGCNDEGRSFALLEVKRSVPLSVPPFDFSGATHLLPIPWILPVSAHKKGVSVDPMVSPRVVRGGVSKVDLHSSV